MKALFATIFTVAVVAAISTPVRAQDDVVRMSLSTQLKSDPEQMTEAEAVKPGDPIYFVVKLSPKYKYTLADLASTDPKTGEKNVFVCFDMNSYRVGQICSGILKSPVSDQDLNRKAASFTLVPAANDMNAENIKTIGQIMDMIDSKSGQDFDLKILYKNFDTQKSASFKVTITMADYAKSRWKSYDDLFKARANAEKQKEDAVAGERTKVIVTDWVKTLRSKRTDSALEKDIMKWWRGPDPSKIADPVIRIYFLEPNYEIARNEFGIVIRKTVDALILWKDRNAANCHIQWRSFGYQSLGGAAFNTEMEAWTLANNGYPRYYQLTEGREVRTGAWYDVDCASFAH